MTSIRSLTLDQEVVEHRASFKNYFLILKNISANIFNKEKLYYLLVISELTIQAYNFA